MKKLTIRLIDRLEPLVAEWQKVMPSSTVEIVHGDIFSRPADALVSPANSFGFMDGGIDLAYSRRFGWDLEARVRAAILEDFGGELLVGQAFTVPTGDEEFPHLIVAPTMRVPAEVSDPTVARLAMRAAVREALARGFETLSVPGLGTGAGTLRPEWAAAYMFAGLRDAMRGPHQFASLESAGEDHAAPRKMAISAVEANAPKPVEGQQ